MIPCPDCGEPYTDGFALIVHRRMKHPAKFAEFEEAERAKARAKMDAPQPELFEERTKRRNRNQGPDDL